MPEFEKQQNRTPSSYLTRPAQLDRSLSRPAHDDNPLLAQQQALGNQAMLRFAQSCPQALPSASICPFGGVCNTCPAQVQTKLRINQPGDKYEQEANRVAEQVMRMPESQVQGQASEDEKEDAIQSKSIANITPLVQRQNEEEREEEDTLQSKTMPARSPEFSSNLEDRINASRTSGQPLTESERIFFEPQFGADFSGVRVHRYSEADTLNRELNARAFTTGQDIFFRHGEYDTGNSGGRELLAHELTHVVQQRDRLLVQQQAPSTTVQCTRLPTANFARFVTRGRVRCCRDRGRGECPPHLGVARRGDPRPQNGMNLVATIAGHRPGVEYGFVQVIHFRRCIRYSAGVGGGWGEVDSGGPGHGDSPVADATCRISNSRNEITMTDAPGYGRGGTIRLGGRTLANTEELTLRMNAVNWVIARERPGRWERISELFRWHSVTGIRRDAAGNWELTPSGNRIGEGHTWIGGCPPVRPRR